MFGFFASVAQSLAARFAPRAAVGTSSNWLIDWVRDQTSLSGVSVTRANAETIACFFQAISLISGDVAKLPWLVYRGLPSGGRERDRRHAAAYLLRRKPSSNTTAFLWKRTLCRHVMLHGNGYALIVRDPLTLAPRELIPLDPTKVQPGYDRGGRVVYRLGAAGQGRVLGQYDVYHWRVFSDDGLVGKSICDLARESLGLTKATENFGASFFGNQSIGGGILEYPQKLDDQTIASVRRQWEQLRSRENAHKVAVLQSGVKFQAITIPPEEAQFLGTREFQRQEIASWFNLPAHKLGDGSRTSFNSLEQENQSYLESTLEPYLAAAEDESHDKLLTEQQKREGDYEIEAQRAAILKPDLAARYSAYSLGITNGFLKPNEARAYENLPPEPGGDQLRFPLNTSPAGGPADSGAPPEPPKPPPKKQRRRKPKTTPPAADPVVTFRELLAAAVAPKIRWECSALERFARKPETFASEAAAFYVDHAGRLKEALAPALAAAAATLGRTLDSGPAVAQYIAESQERLAHSSGAIADVVRDWPGRAAELARAILD